MSRWTRACGPDVNLAIVVAPIELTHLIPRRHSVKSNAYRLLKTLEILILPLRVNQPSTYFHQNDHGDIPLQSWKKTLFLIFCPLNMSYNQKRRPKSKIRVGNKRREITEKTLSSLATGPSEWSRATKARGGGAPTFPDSEFPRASNILQPLRKSHRLGQALHLRSVQDV